MESVKSNIIPLQVKPEKRPFLLRHPAYKKRDVVDLFVEAKAYTQGRIPVPNKETAIAILISRDEAMSTRTLRPRPLIGLGDLQGCG